MRTRYDTIMVDLSDDAITEIAYCVSMRLEGGSPLTPTGVEMENFVNQLRNELQHRAAERAANHEDLI
jgi:hypothetical protein